MSFKIKRAYDPPAPADGYRVLVDRLWPRGVTKAKLHLDAWMKDIAPSAALRQWIHSDMSQWPEFRRRYLKELATPRDLIADLRKRARAGTVTLVYAARDPKQNHALILKDFLERA